MCPSGNGRLAIAHARSHSMPADGTWDLGTPDAGRPPCLVRHVQGLFTTSEVRHRSEDPPRSLRLFRTMRAADLGRRRTDCTHFATIAELAELPFERWHASKKPHGPNLPLNGQHMIRRCVGEACMDGSQLVSDPHFIGVLQRCARRLQRCRAADVVVAVVTVNAATPCRRRRVRQMAAAEA